MYKNIQLILFSCLFTILISCDNSNHSKNNKNSERSHSNKNLINEKFNGNGSDVILQAFHWESHEGANGEKWWKVIENESTKIKEAGFSIVWLPPVSDAGSDDGYLPRELYNFNSNFGTKEELSKAVTALKPLNIMADVVFNHRLSSNGYTEFRNPDWGAEAICEGDFYYDKNNNYSEVYYGGTGNSEDILSYENCSYAQDLDLYNDTVRKDLKEFLKRLNEIGFNSIRYDMVKGFKASRIAEFNQYFNTIDNLYFSIGENLDYDRDILNSWIDNTAMSGRPTSTALDFSTRNSLYLSIEEGNYWRLNDGGNVSGLIKLKPEWAVTFIENHDSEERRWYLHHNGEGDLDSPMPYFPYSKTLMGYAYILTHPGTPCVYWIDWQQFKQTINSLIQLRKELNINSSSQVEVINANTYYAAIIDNKLLIKIGPGDWSPGSGWKEKMSEPNRWKIWVKEENENMWQTAYFRGTPNNWEATQMEKKSDYFETIQQFGNTGNPRFKVTKYNNWQESYPGQDYVVAANTKYRIKFYPATKTFELEKIEEEITNPWQTAYFRGTANSWGLSKMEKKSNYFEITQTFGNGDVSGGPRFKITRFNNWQESYPGQDYVVDANTTYRIKFYPATQVFSLEKL